MKFLIRLYIIGVLLVFSGCSVLKTVSVDTLSAEQYMGYQPIDPIPVDNVTMYDTSSNAMNKVYWKSIENMEVVRNLLPLQSAQVAVSQTSSDGKVSFSSASVSGEKGSYEVIMDYMKFRVEDVVDDSGEFIGTGRIGVGLRIRARVLTAKANLNIGSLGKLGLEASKENISGGISVDIIGIDSENVTNLIPLTSEINQTSIQSALQALASIKSKLWEDGTTITPHLIAIQQARENKSDEVRRKLTSVSYVHSSFGDRIREYWTPNDNVNEANEDRLIKWMGENGLDPKKGAIPQFLVDSSMEKLRKKAIKDLNIK